MSVTPDLDRRTLLRRAAAAGLLVTPAAGLLSACAGSTPSQNDDSAGEKSNDNPFGVQDGSAVKVVIFNGGLGDAWAKEDQAIFNAKYPNVTVNMSSTQKIKTEEQPKMATQPSDVVMNSGADMMDISTLVNEGAIEPLDDLLAAPAWDSEGTVADTLLPGTVGDGTYQGKFFVVNVAYTVWGNWYNSVLFDKEGWTPPKTFDDFFALAPKIKAKGMAPYVYDAVHGYYPRWALMATVWKSAGKQAVIDIDNLKENAWRAEGVLPALEAWEKLVKDKLLLPGKLDHTQSQQAWLDGKAAFIQVGTWLKNEMAATIPPGFEMKISDYWGLGATDKAPNDVYAGAGEGIVVPAKAPNKAAAKEFLRAVLSKAGSAKFAELTKSLASTKGSGDNVQDAALASANELMKNASSDLISIKLWNFYADLDKESQNLSAELMAGRLTAAQFVDKMQAAADKVAKDSSITKQTRDA
ncbi:MULTISPECIES: N-acetylglucosamine/diacetylchitobiose ABC transporter substrate-binding protein [unclassified Micromonospora]|uniref:N-acetylglucosamine/diacetylchitobiose ABC transporter substrate-binding protein n=1 Tax=unclassified Micromonospora TaxID=2617518 RepID=UPI001B390C2A|nr:MULTISPECIES: N-acetylglucosamine/diacetylchitobiose ABC transporter substrate-binding protein [unclassified Micromonospora]MBQ1026214.1 N-acetylglucosamine/diacetylchitobiose ABC transporter substrate-binding protein [Micromonospora sp. C95]MCZ7423871.1 N-acetylglucosamine/diacetylchitobiose ABC transporter substrate-binding protein [Verrucosispora sp. WMMA2121]WBB91625.1 N-acetylglucosamine/diacetylchitobiose ABC transporter substrate-binding protein [Verrucosispora sp. WMMC514]